MATNSKRSNSSMASEPMALNYPSDNLYFIENLEDDEINTVDIPDCNSPSGKRASKAYNVVAVDIKGNRVVIEAWAEAGLVIQKYLR